MGIFPYNSWPVTLSETTACANSRIILLGNWLTGSFVVSPEWRIQSMSIVVWKVMRQLPKPVLLLLLFFVLAAVCRA